MTVYKIHKQKLVCYCCAIKISSFIYFNVTDGKFYALVVGNSSVNRNIDIDSRKCPSVEIHPWNDNGLRSGAMLATAIQFHKSSTSART